MVAAPELLAPCSFPRKKTRWQLFPHSAPCGLLGTMARWWGCPALDQWLKRTKETMWQMSFHGLMPSSSHKTMENRGKAKPGELFCPKSVKLLSYSLHITQQGSPWWWWYHMAAGVLRGNSLSRVNPTKERGFFHFCPCFLKGTKPLPSTTGARKKFWFLAKNCFPSN